MILVPIPLNTQLLLKQLQIPSGVRADSRQFCSICAETAVKLKCLEKHDENFGSNNRTSVRISVPCALLSITRRVLLAPFIPEFKICRVVNHRPEGFRDDNTFQVEHRNGL